MTIKTIRNNKKILLITVISFVVILTLMLSTSLAKYQTTQSIKVVEGTINYKLADLNMIALYQENSSGTYDEISIMPGSGYVINEESSYCTINGEKDTNVILRTIDGNHTITNIQKGSKCYLYFDDIKGQTVKSILATKTISERTRFDTRFEDDTTGIVYITIDDDGISFYFAGAPTDNWVKFGGFYWRIIRINGDGSIRLIYQGTAANTTGTETQIGTSAFNPSRVDNMYVGYMYTSGSVHGLGTSSTIKGVLDKWYDDNLASYASYIDTNAGFCGDRELSSGTGTGTTTTYYGAYLRLYTNKAPSLKCTNSSDLYTVSSSNKGNKALSKPIGLITADEVAYAGGHSSDANRSYYLYTGQSFWTLSPYGFNSSGRAYVFSISQYYSLNGTDVSSTNGVRPVINLRSDVTFKGSGTSRDPYIVS